MIVLFPKFGSQNVLITISDHNSVKPRTYVEESVKNLSPKHETFKDRIEQSHDIFREGELKK